MRRGIDVDAGDLDDEAAADALRADSGHLHWVHDIDNSALPAFALARGAGDFQRTITLAARTLAVAG